MLEQTQSEGKLVGALVNGLAVLRYLRQASGPVGLTQVARDLSINPSTCFNLLRTLVHEGMVHFDAQTKGYRLSLGIVNLAQGTLDKESHIRMLHPKLQQIATDYGVAMNLWQRIAPNRVLLVDRAEPDAAVQLSMRIGQRLPAYVGAFGRCFAAFDSVSIEDLLEEFSEIRLAQPLDPEDWLAQIEETRRSGFAIDRGFFVRGITTASAPVFDSEDKPFLAISAICIAEQIDEMSLTRLAADIRSLANSACLNSS